MSAHVSSTRTSAHPQLLWGASLTLILVGLNLLVFIYQATLPPAQLDQFILRWSAIPVEITERVDLPPTVPFPIVGTVFSALFLHISPLHLLLNMLLLLIFGMVVERQYGAGLMLLIYLVGGMVGSAAQISASPHTLASLVGASGAIAALIGATLILPRAGYRTGIVVAWGAWQVASLVDSLLNPRWISGGLAIWSHVGGLAAGIAAALLIELYCELDMHEHPQPWEQHEFDQ